MMLFMITLFYVLTPGIFVTLPDSLPKTDKYTVALVHAIIFGLIYMIAHKIILQITSDNNAENFATCQWEKQKCYLDDRDSDGFCCNNPQQADTIIKTKKKNSVFGITWYTDVKTCKYGKQCGVMM